MPAVASDVPQASGFSFDDLTAAYANPCAVTDSRNTAKNVL
jgi:hypothetical protein